MVGRQCYFFWGDSLKPCESCPTLTAIETGRSEHKIVRTPDGRVWDEAGEPILDDDGNVVAVVEIAQDITEHDLAQAAIESSRKSIADVLDTAPFQIWSFNGATYDYVNREYFDFTGLKSEGPLTPETWTAYVHPDDLESAQRVWLAAWEAKAEHDNFFRLMREDGVYRDFWCHAVPIFDEAGEFQRFQGYNIDISERKTAEEALIAGERRFRAAIGASPVPMALTDQESNITFLNPAFTKTLGYTREDLPTLAQWWPSAYPDPEYRRSTMDAWGAEPRTDRSDRGRFSRRWSCPWYARTALTRPFSSAPPLSEGPRTNCWRSSTTSPNARRRRRTCAAARRRCGNGCASSWSLTGMSAVSSSPISSKQKSCSP